MWARIGERLIRASAHRPALICVFCRIAAGEAPSRTVHRTDGVVAFLDANPLAPGHTLVVPDAHHERLEALPDEPAAYLFRAVHHLVGPVRSAVDADGGGRGRGPRSPSRCRAMTSGGSGSTRCPLRARRA